MSDDDQTVTSIIETIAPETAERMLGRNTNNRSVSRRQVDLFARDMKRGAWKVNGEAIKFSRTGRLLDGQHRLGVREIRQAFHYARHPRTARRSAADHGLRQDPHVGQRAPLRGETQSTPLAAMTRAVYVADQLGLEAAAQNDLHPTNGELVEFLETTPQLRTLLSAAQSFNGRSNGLLPPSMFAALWWTLAHVDTGDANRFFEHLATGADLEQGSPILALRAALFDMKTRGSRANRAGRRRIAVLTVKAWNKWRAGKTVKHLRYGGDERFPEPR